jgi:hypothetical protein
MAVTLHYSASVCARRKSVNIFYIIGVVVVVLFVLGYFGLR